VPAEPVEKKVKKTVKEGRMLQGEKGEEEGGKTGL